MLIKQNIRFSRIEIDAGRINETSSELLCFDLFYADHKLRIFLCYRPPSLNCNNNDANSKNALLMKLLNEYFDPRISNYYVGDFNLPYINWDIYCPRTDGVHDAFFDCFSDLGLYQFVSEPTHSSSVGSANNILDLILCNDSTWCIYPTILTPR